RGFYLWVNGDAVDSNLLAQADAATKIPIASNNGVGLLDASDELIDSLAWGTASNGFPAATTTNPGANMALVLVDVNNPAAGFTIAASHPRNSSYPADFAPSEEHGETPTSTPDSTASTTTPESQATTTDDSALNAPPSGGGSAVETVAKSFAVKITEILANPAGDDSGNEQVELINTGSQYVNLEGWMIGDSTATSSKNNVLVLHNILMPPGSVTAIIIPKGLFAFNNTGGDEARLYFADKTLADAAAYADTAPEGQSYQQINGSWLWGAPSLGMRNFAVAAPSPASSANPAAQVVSPLSITEIMPNPEGADEGREWVELYNNSDAEVPLQGYFLDDDGTGAPGGSAWQLGDVSAAAHQYMQLIIPEDAFTLVNTQNAVRLFSPARQLIERIAYAGVSEGKSYAKDDQGKWNVSFPTPGAENLVELPDYAVVISEVLPNPAGDDDEFIELQNVGGNDINVKDFIVSIGSRALKIADAATVTPFSFYTVYEDDLPVHLRNAGQTITVGDNFGRQLASLTYGKAPAGQSFALDSSGAYVWTSGLT
ncbi:MAG TPA: lamin tail domain-containing protein, partial [Patescibacteria group bacterium]|nr:lamin tail domain-containing protein [Patescibacteria group bacterium]